MAHAPAKGGRVVGLFAAVVTWALWSPGRAPAQAPRVGEVQRVPVITLSMQVGSTEKEAKQVTYTPPPGWYVRSHSVDCAAKYGNSSFSVSTVPQHWDWSSEEKVTESYRLLIDLAAEAQDAGLRARLAHQRDCVLAGLREARSSHHALMVEATARGEGLLRGGGGLQLTVTAELVYVGTDEGLGRAVAQHRATLE